MKRINSEILDNLADTTPTTNNHSSQRIDFAKDILNRIISEGITTRQKEILLLYFYENYNQREIAKMLGIDNSTVCRTLNRAIKRIENILKFYKIR